MAVPWRESGRPCDPADHEQPGQHSPEVVAVTYETMGLLPQGRLPNWYDPGRFWSGDDLELALGAKLGDEIAVELPG